MTFQSLPAVSLDQGVLPPTGRQPSQFRKRFERIIMLIHRWIGICASLFILFWLISGIVLAYVRYPVLRPEDRISVLPPIDWQLVNTSPGDAVKALGNEEYPRLVRLEMAGTQPVYRVTTWDRSFHAVFANSGQPMRPATPEQAVEIVRVQMKVPGATLRRGNITRDQWTTANEYDHERPFHSVSLNDEDGTEVYVTASTGEIVLLTKRWERFWSYFGAIPHWLYFVFLKHSYTLWSGTIYVIGGLSTFVVLSGIWIGISRMRARNRYANGSISPFRNWMKWHHVFGLFGGIFLALWMITGVLTLYPMDFLAQRSVTPLELKRLAGNTSPNMAFAPNVELGRLAEDARRVTFRWWDGRPIAVAVDGASRVQMLDLQTGAPVTLTTEMIARSVAKAAPGHRVTFANWLSEPDEYWHSGFYPKHLPVVRVGVDDPQKTWYHINPHTGEVLGLLDNIGRVDRWSLVAIHDIDWHWLLVRRPYWDIVLFLTLIPGILIAVTALVIGWRRLRNSVSPPISLDSGLASPLEQGNVLEALSIQRDPESWLVVYASQSGSAEALARRTLVALQDAGLNADISDLGDVSLVQLAGAGHALFIIATTGEGDPPDRSVWFARNHMTKRPALRGLTYDVLALGDSSYPKFCNFGKAIDKWLNACGASARAPMITVDNGDPAALLKWSEHISALTGQSSEIVVKRRPFAPWTLTRCEVGNPGSPGNAAYYVELAGVGDWQAGDILEVVCGDSESGEATGDAPVRCYSIASIPQDGSIHLLVRQAYTEDGQLGIGSSWLTKRKAIGEQILARIRTNHTFNAPKDDRPVILVGNGTGIAGLRSLMRQRVAAGHDRNWLLYGERTALHDSFYGDDIAGWRSGRHMERLNLVYSRDGGDLRYVQDALAAESAEIRTWVDRGAAIYVCGSADTMAPEVDRVLRNILGEDLVDMMLHDGRYCRDIY